MAIPTLTFRKSFKSIVKSNYYLTSYQKNLSSIIPHKLLPHEKIIMAVSEEYTSGIHYKRKLTIIIFIFSSSPISDTFETGKPENTKNSQYARCILLPGLNTLRNLTCCMSFVPSDYTCKLMILQNGIPISYWKCDALWLFRSFSKADSIFCKPTQTKNT